MLRRLLLPVTLVGAVAVPMMMVDGGLEGIKKTASSVWNKKDNVKDEKTFDVNKLHCLAEKGQPKTESERDLPPVEGAPVANLEDVLRFDITPQWVMQRWSRVTTQLANLDMEGIRVPLVTGTESGDLAGSLTYYFDNQKHVQRITFHGYTDHEAKLTGLMIKKYGLKLEPSLGRGLYLAKWSGRPKSALWIKNASVVRADQPWSHLEIQLELNRPSHGYKLSQNFAQVLAEQQAVGRW